jgi:tRNA nucleotidyltransferase (CCA-adding enzyme)
MRIKRQDADVLERGLVLGRRLVGRVRRGPGEAELYDLVSGEPLEAVLAAMTLDETDVTAGRLGRYLDVTRQVRLEITGEDLLALGFPTSPQIGEVLRSVLHLKLNGVVRGRDQELEAAARMRP